MIEYRKQGTRMFFKVEAETNYVVRVLNKQKFSVITSGEMPYVVEEALIDGFLSTEQEFKEALQVALERINKMKI
jgi:hypothetical protein